MEHRKHLGEVLVEAGIISQQQLEEVLRLQKIRHRFLNEILVERGWSTEHDICQAVSKMLNVEFIDLTDIIVDQQVLLLVPKSLATEHAVLPLFIKDKTLSLAMENPLDIDTIQRLEFDTGLAVKQLIVLPSQLRDAIRKYYNLDENASSLIGIILEDLPLNLEREEEKTETRMDISEVLKLSEGDQVVKLVNRVIADGINLRASDIHIEPTAEYVTVRYRIDGILTERSPFPKWLHLPMVSRIKVMAAMNMTEYRKPQDGGLRVSYFKRKLDLRVSTLPTLFGEKITLRILDKNMMLLDISNVGLSPTYLNSYLHRIHRFRGLILVTGPTGSGKTTTLYASLNAIKNIGQNIITLEDPIEYQLDGINQVPINHKGGLTFASGLRSVLRQDPDVIFVGEIRDAETAQIAIQAAETGHLVFSTLHTNDSVSTVDRLFNLGILPDIVASTLTVAIAQRLVRKICPHCKVQYKVTAQELRRIGIDDELHQEFVCYHGTGCGACQHPGYNGRIGIYELFIPDEQLQEAIAKRPTKKELKHLAIATGMRTMLEDGIEKIRQGVTTIEEVVRVCDVDQKVAVNISQQ